MSRSLYDLAGDIIGIQHALESEDADQDLVQEAIRCYLEDSKDSIEQKVDSYCSLMRNLEILVDARAQEAKRLHELAKADSAKVDRLKTTLLWFLKDVAGISKVDTPHFRVSVAANGGKAPLIVPESQMDWPAQYVKEVVVRELDKDAIRKDLESGVEVDGCMLAERGFHLSIR